jgi:methylthioribose-1-phosphate isomerase
LPDQPADAGESPATPPDLERRRFFRRFAGEMIGAAATVVGVAQELQRSSAAAAAAILDPEQGAAALARHLPPEASEPVAGGPSGFRTPFRFADERRRTLLVIDQRRLPDELSEIEVRGAADGVRVIREMAVRGAPAIGQVAALALAQTADLSRDSRPYARRAAIRGGANALRRARPTAINLGWAIDRVMARYEAVGDLSDDGDAIADALRDEADAIVAEATDDHGRLAQAGLAALPEATVEHPLRLLTHCNTGPLACGQFGTALGIVQAAHFAGRELQVWVDETRPYLQGARLTAWELAQAGVPHTLIADVAAGSLMARGEVDAVLVGADRIAANGDTANKVGTYPLAVLAARHGIPFFVCAPLSSVDPATADGDGIPIEERAESEVLELRGVRIAPADTRVHNPAFDVTPADLITAIITEEGALRPPFGPALAEALQRRQARRAEARPAVDPPVAIEASA